MFVVVVFLWSTIVFLFNEVDNVCVCNKGVKEAEPASSNNEVLI